MVSKKALLKIRASISKVADLMSPNEENVQSILNWIIPDIDPNDLALSLKAYYKYLETGDQQYVRYFDPVPVLFAKYTFLTTHMNTTIHVGKTWWPWIQKYVSNPDYILHRIGEKNPQIAQMLNSELGAKFIEYYTDRLYKFFQTYFFLFPRYHLGDGGLIQYKLVNKHGNLYGWVCRACGTVIATEDIDRLSYMKRKYPMMKVRKDTKS